MTFKNMKEQSAFLDADGGRSHERQMQFRPLVTEHPVNGKSGFQCCMALVYKIVELGSIEKSKEFIA